MKIVKMLKEGVGGRRMAFLHAHIPVWQKGLVDVIKLQIVRLGNYSGLLTLAQRHHKST